MSSPPHFDPQVLEPMLDFSDLEFCQETIRELQGIFSENLERRLTELPDFLEKSDAAALRSLFHQLKGGSASIGYAAFSDYCSIQEICAKSGTANDPDAATRLAELHDSAQEAVDRYLAETFA